MTPAHVFSYEFCEVCQESIFKEDLQVTASESKKLIKKNS